MAKLRKNLEKVNISDLSSRYPNLAACLAINEDLDRIEAMIPHLDGITLQAKDSQVLNDLVSTDFCSHAEVLGLLGPMHSAYLMSICERMDFEHRAEITQKFISSLNDLLIYHEKRFTGDEIKRYKALQEFALV
ncbi:hypothetical protein [Lewinella sp. LCG006]|uniref:hypothetical protein n=1 Tax=Lewinella sp. LCG006 TaxID=3231911 RepID=UPI0034610F07